MIEFLKSHNVDEKLIEDLLHFRKFYDNKEENLLRIPKPRFYYYGREVWNMAIAALLEGEHILISGPKATGKNVLADNLACAFNRPAWTVSFHVNTDSSALIGTDTFVDNRVDLRKGSVYQCAENGGFGIFDEINMSKNDAVAVLHSALDHRRIIDVPGYDKIYLNEATRFIGTMNYGYAGTKELNEALVSRFMVIDIPPMTKSKLTKILLSEFPNLNEEYLEQFSGLFLDLQLKSQNSEISTKAVDLRGLIGALRTINRGLEPLLAVKMGILGKTFDEFEKEIISDVIELRIPKSLGKEDIFRL